MQDIEDAVILKRMSKALYTLARATGGFGMIGGQCVDVEYCGKKMSEDVMRYTYALKTGALLQEVYLQVQMMKKPKCLKKPEAILEKRFR